jgi:hypothetical protein
MHENTVVSDVMLIVVRFQCPCAYVFMPILYTEHEEKYKKGDQIKIIQKTAVQGSFNTVN